MRRTLPAALTICLIAAVLAVAPIAPASASTTSTRTLLNQLAVSPEHAAGYQRALFKLWDAQGGGCNTRDKVLITEAVARPHVSSTCTLTGGKWRSRYDGTTTTNPSTFDIDHLVPLAEAWQSGAWRWTAKTREAYANDLGYGPDLVAVTAHANRSKGDSEPSAYLPPLKSFDCTYEAWWVAVKWRWHLSVNSAEKTWLSNHLAACKWPTVATPTRPTITYSSGTGGASGSSASALGGVRIVQIYFDSPGSDTGSNSSLNAEWVKIKNTTGTRKVITGWTLHDSSSHQYRFPTTALAAHVALRIHTGHGTNSRYDRYWDSSSYIWNNTGDRATLRNARGTIVARCAYTKANDPSKSC